MNKHKDVAPAFWVGAIMEHQQLQVTLRHVGSIRLATGDGSNRWEFGYCAKGGRQLCEGARAPCIAAGYSCIAASFGILSVHAGPVLFSTFIHGCGASICVHANMIAIATEHLINDKQPYASRLCVYLHVYMIYFETNRHYLQQLLVQVPNLSMRAS